MDNQEIFNQIRELQKQRTLLSAQDTALVNKINELRDKIALKNIKKGYYTDNNGLYCKVYITLEDLDFEVDSVFWHDDVLGTVYCQDKDTKEPVWIESRGDEGGSWWEVNRVPEFYKNQSKTKE
jgi:hypothetical protein